MGNPGIEGKAQVLLPEEEGIYTPHCHVEPQCLCGGTIRANRLSQRHQVIDLPQIVSVVTKYWLYAGTCQRCHNITKRHSREALVRVDGSICYGASPR